MTTLAVPDPGELLRACRNRAWMSQRELASRAGTSAPTIAMYEAGRKEPRLTTLARLLAATNTELHLIAVPTEPSDVETLTREQRRSLALNRAVVRKLLANPEAALAKARKNIETMRKADGGPAERWLGEWEHLLSGPIELIVAVLETPTQRAASLRQVTPFAGILSPAERWKVYRDFRKQKSRSAS